MPRSRLPVAIAVLMAAAYAVVFTWLGVARFESTFSYDWRDEAVNNQMMFNTASGRPLLSTVMGEHRHHRHFRPAFLWASLAYVVHRDAHAWYALAAFFVAAAALAAFRLGEKIFASPWAGLGAAAAWLCWPAVHDLTLGAMDTETLAGPLWLFAALFFAERRPIAFWIAAVAALTCKETHGPVLAAFGVIALVQRRPKSWIAAPILVGLAWFVLAVKVIIPSYFPEFPTVYNRFIGVASTEFPAGFFKALIADPGATLGLVFSREHLALVYRIAKPFAFLAVFGPLPLVAALPIGGLIFLLKDPLPVRQVHILAGILPFVFWASLEGARRLSQFAARVTKIAPEKRGRVHGAAAWLLPAVAAVQVAGPGTFGLYQNYGNRPMASMRASNVLDPAFRTPTDAERRALDAVRSIPPDIKVAANARFLLYLSARPEFQEFGIQHTVKDFAGVPLVVLWFPRAECRTCVYARWTPELLSLAAHLVEAGDYGVAAFDPAFAILSSRRYPPQGFEPRADLEEPFRERMNELLEIAEAGSPWPRDLPRPDAPFFR